MTPQTLNDLFTPDELRAFAAMWPMEKGAAERQARELLELFARPKSNQDEIAAWVRRLMIGLLSGKPELGAWLQAVAGGSFELRPEQKYAVPGVDERPARFISRGLNTLDGGVSAMQRQIGITDDSIRTGLMLVGYSSLVKEFRNVALARVAIGTAWPLVAGVDKYLTNAEHRYLYRFGEDADLQKRLATAAGSTLSDYLAERFPEGVPNGSRAALHERELPAGVDLHAHFTREEAAVLRYREGLFRGLDLDCPSPPTEPGPDLIEADVGLLKRLLDKPQEAFSYFKNADGTQRTELNYDEDARLRLRQMLPLLMRAGAQEELLAAAARAYYRGMFDSRLTGRVDRALHEEVRDWVRRGITPPPDLRPEHAYLFEEEGAYLFYFGEIRHLEGWRELGFFPDPRPAARPDLTPILEGWMQLWLPRSSEQGLK